MLFFRFNRFESLLKTGIVLWTAFDSVFTLVFNSSYIVHRYPDFIFYREDFLIFSEVPVYCIELFLGDSFGRTQE